MTKTRTGAARVAHGLATAFIAVFATAGLLLLAVALLARTDGNGVTRVAGHPVMTVLSNSMTPSFRAGDILVADSPAQPDQLAVGDVITYRVGDGGDLVTHRIIRKERDPAETFVTYRTQGDANNAADEAPVTPEQVVGVYSWHIPYAGYAFEAARSQTGFALLIFVAGAALLLPVLARWWRSAADDAAETPVAQMTASAETVPSCEPKGGGN